MNSANNKYVTKGKSVFLRFPKARDCAEFTSLNRASTKLHRGLVSPPKNQEQFDRFLRRCRRSNVEGLLMCKNEEDVIVGCVVLSEIVRGVFQSAYMGYYVGAPYANRGYMTEGIQLVLRYAFTKLKLHRLEANIQPGNIPSLALVRRAGFSREGYSPKYLRVAGRWRDHERWTILAEDWKTHQRKLRNQTSSKVIS